MIFLALLVIVVVIVLVWWWWQNRPAGEPTIATVQEEPVSVAPVVEEEEPVSFALGQDETPAPEPDDLRRIEGIGPKISAVLQENGILTFDQLAAADTDRLSQILMDAGLRRLADPATWPEQAGLAAAGKWEELTKLQDELQGGRRA